MSNRESPPGQQRCLGAVSHAIKSIGRERGMTYNRHEHARHRLGDLIHGDNSPESDAIIAGYSTAHDLHQNFLQRHRGNPVDRSGVGFNRESY